MAHSAITLLEGDDWLNYSERRAAFATITRSAVRSRESGANARLWLFTLLGGGAIDRLPNPDGDEMMILPSIAAGWVWGYHIS